MTFEEAFELAKKGTYEIVPDIRGLNVFSKGKVTWYKWCEPLLVSWEENGQPKQANIHYPHWVKDGTYTVEQSDDKHYSHIFTGNGKHMYYGAICPGGERLCECNHCIHQNRQRGLVGCWNYRYETLPKADDNNKLMKQLESDEYGVNAILKQMVGMKCKRIFMDENNLRFELSKNGERFCVNFEVYGDCCSHSWFHDFYGVKDLLGKTITDIKEKHLEEGDTPCSCSRCKDGDVIKVYGYQIGFEDSNFGDRTAVFSFRNDSNGYYGGSLEKSTSNWQSTELFDDFIPDFLPTSK